ncbi:DUF5931 domain-containing protein [Acrocarpospora macrocephala]|uniref:Histidine kinase n=1 Tax=Acrocarpospora macrocephala TaxID=150177 RepID=A0A5M3WUQ4_9ACTN|nr:DUF5931 domain-containing protein [Acrocarpospora macrocephala]GES10353.1 histidine kinase [Acrocarpospora macrocephala]
MGIEGPFWRAIAVFRIASLGYAAILLLQSGGYAHPVTGWIVLGVMAVWTAAATYAYSVEALRGWPLLTLDLLLSAACLLSTVYVQGPQATANTMPVTATWVAAPVLAWGVYSGRRGGGVAAAVMSVADLWLRGVRGFDLAAVPVNGAVLLFLAGIVIGHVARLAKQAEERMQRAIEIEAAGRERERLARGIHDSVLQVLALVQRRGAEIGGEAADLGRLAGEQEAVLRELIRSGPRPDRSLRSRRRFVPARRAPADRADLGDALRRYGSAQVTVATPADPVPLSPRAVDELTAAVGNALDNVRRHCGEHARAWILVESEPDRVIVTVRDDGPGIPEGRLAEAAADGRLGVSQSIRGRVADLGGSVTILSSSDGTEIEMSVPF